MIATLRVLALAVAFTVLFPSDAIAYVGQGIALDAHGRKLDVATKKTKANGRTLGPSEESTKPALGRVLERYANAKLSEPLATMPIGELSAAVEALTPTSSLDRGESILERLEGARQAYDRTAHRRALEGEPPPWPIPYGSTIYEILDALDRCPHPPSKAGQIARIDAEIARLGAT